MTTPLVTAVIPTRNRCSLVFRAIKSVLNQTYPKVDVVVVVDGPDRATVDAVRALADDRVKIVALQKAVGGSEARNVGVRAASGEYIALLDDDDVWLPKKIEKQIALLGPGADHEILVVSRYIRSRDGYPDEIWPVRLPRQREPLCEFMLSSRCGFQTPVLFASRDLLLQVPFAAGLKRHQDWDWLLRVACRPKFRLLIVDEVLARITVWPPASTTSMSRQLDWQFTAAWGGKMQRLGLMTRKAYGLLLVKVCLPTARRQAASPQTVLSIFRDLLISGNPSMLTILDALATAILPIGLRQVLRGNRLVSAATRLRLRFEIS